MVTSSSDDDVPVHARTAAASMGKPQSDDPEDSDMDEAVHRWTRRQRNNEGRKCKHTLVTDSDAMVTSSSDDDVPLHAKPAAASRGEPQSDDPDDSDLDEAVHRWTRRQRNNEGRKSKRTLVTDSDAMVTSSSDDDVPVHAKTAAASRGKPKSDDPEDSDMDEAVHRWTRRQRNNEGRKFKRTLVTDSDAMVTSSSDDDVPVHAKTAAASRGKPKSDDPEDSDMDEAVHRWTRRQRNNEGRKSKRTLVTDSDAMVTSSSDDDVPLHARTAAASRGKPKSDDPEDSDMDEAVHRWTRRQRNNEGRKSKSTLVTDSDGMVTSSSDDDVPVHAKTAAASRGKPKSDDSEDSDMDEAVHRWTRRQRNNEGRKSEEQQQQAQAALPMTSEQPHRTTHVGHGISTGCDADASPQHIDAEATARRAAAVPPGHGAAPPLNAHVQLENQPATHTPEALLEGVQHSLAPPIFAASPPAALDAGVAEFGSGTAPKHVEHIHPASIYYLLRFGESQL
eukprot:jgi/Chrzof1/2111/Cz11g03010.t1